MPTVVTCPECQRKLKVAPASIGKSVKCTCGNVFKAREAADPTGPSTPVPAADIILVSCESCQTRLKVPASARGRKMKCSKCGTTFVVGDMGASPVPPPSSKPMPPLFDDEELEERPVPRKSSRPAAPFLDEEEEAPRPVKKSARAKPPMMDDDVSEIEDEPRPRPRGKVRPPVDDMDDAPSQRPKPAPASRLGGCVLNLFVLFVVMSYLGAFVPIYLGYVPLPFERPPANLPVIRHPPEHPIQPIQMEKKGEGAKKNQAPEANQEKQDGDEKKESNVEPENVSRGSIESVPHFAVVLAPHSRAAQPRSKLRG